MAGVYDPTVQQLRSLLTLAEELHFGRAAARLYLTQPALSLQIRTLERRLGVRLFARTSRRVEVTPVGRALLPLVRNIVGATDELRDAALSSAAAGDTLRLRVGLTDCATALAPTRRVIAALTALYPGLEIDLRVVDLVEQATGLATGRIDAAFVYLPVDDGFHVHPLTTEPRVACLSSADPLAGRASLTLADLADRPMVSLTPETSRTGRAFWAADPRPDGAPVRYTDHHVTRVESLLSAVSFDGACAFLPAVAAELYPRPDVRYLPVTDLVPCTFGLARPAADHDTPRSALLERACRRACEEAPPSDALPAPDHRPRPAAPDAPDAPGDGAPEESAAPPRTVLAHR
ncbi:LysR family transcriptional regulator [Streptomyces sp. BBFR2]|uniref:LysR family transcriptional regulator n=1 Tax=Streptomyces sp. BBFR2 TaxID=3372854 RepID=UPI0037D9B924